MVHTFGHQRFKCNSSSPCHLSIFFVPATNLLELIMFVIDPYWVKQHHRLYKNVLMVFSTTTVFYHLSIFSNYITLIFQTFAVYRIINIHTMLYLLNTFELVSLTFSYVRALITVFKDVISFVKVSKKLHKEACQFKYLPFKLSQSHHLHMVGCRFKWRGTYS